MIIAGILLAAGTSSRMGQPKQLLPWRGEPLVRHVARQALGAALGGLVVVTGHQAALVREALDGLPVTLVHNERYQQGQASSLRAGLAALPAEAAAALVLLCDQPLLTSGLVDTVAAAFGGEHTAVIPRYGGQRGNPVLLARALFSELMTLEGDQGARTVLQRYPERILWLDLDDPALVTDVDTLEQYEALARATGGAT